MAVLLASIIAFGDSSSWDYLETLAIFIANLTSLANTSTSVLKKIYLWNWAGSCQFLVLVVFVFDSLVLVRKSYPCNWMWVEIKSVESFLITGTKLTVKIAITRPKTLKICVNSYFQWIAATCSGWFSDHSTIWNPKLLSKWKKN